MNYFQVFLKNNLEQVKYIAMLTVGHGHGTKPLTKATVCLKFKKNSGIPNFREFDPRSTNLYLFNFYSNNLAFK